MTRRLATLIAVHAALLSACAERVIGQRENIHHDDFEYSVRNVDTVDRIANTVARGIFYIVTFVVENRARRVEHGWHNNTAYVVDQEGRTYENEPSAQQALAQIRPFDLRGRYLTPPGETGTTLLVFDLPKDVKEPYLKVRGDFLMGDMFDGNQYKRTRVKLF